MTNEIEPVQNILSRLEGVKRTGASWIARCPAHDDQHASLSIGVGNDRSALLKCHAGCSTHDVLARIDLTMSDLFERRTGQSGQSGQNGHRKVTRKRDYEYRSADGTLLAVHRRFDYDTGAKSFAWYTAEGYNSGKVGLDGMPESALPLYGFTELLTAPIDKPILLCEGEKAADAARAHGFTAVSLPGGAAQRDFGDALSPLQERTVYLWPDNDAPGETFMRHVGAALAGIAKEVRHVQPAVINNPTIPPKGDAHDYFAKGGSSDGLQIILEHAPIYQGNLSDSVSQKPASPPTPSVSREWPEPPGNAAFNGLAGEVVRAIDPHTEADQVSVLAHLLAAFGCVIGNGPHFLIGATRHTARIFPVIVGASGKARKGDSSHPVRAILRKAEPLWEGGHIVNGLSSGEGLIYAVRDPIEKKEARKVKGEPTQYETVIADEGIDDKRLLVIEPEFASLLTVMTRQGNILSMIVREAWDQGNLQTLTKSPLRATDAHVVIVGHITVEELRRELTSTQAANGFANRFMWFAVGRSKLLALPKPFDGQIVDILAQCFAERIAKARNVGRMRFSRDAAGLWTAIYEGLSAPRDGLAGSILGRSEAQTLRLAMLYALFDGSEVIDVHHLQSAVELWAYSERSAMFIFGDATGDNVADTIYRALKQNGPMTRSQISNLFSRHESASRISQALELLLVKGKAHTYQVESEGGRPMEMWEAV